MQEIEKMSDTEIASFVDTERAELQKHRFGTAGRNAQAARTAKKNVARALTVLTTRTKETTK